MKNPRIKRTPWTIPPLPEMVQAVRSGNRTALSRAITLTESSRTDDRLYAEQLIQELMPFTGNSIRVGITGVPGAGKSTFIENLGIQLVEQGHSLAVLAVDPSSPVSGGSILGDKTRMEKLSQSPHAFIRPSAAGHTLGGVASRTRESLLLCEAAGYSVIFVETVGVGQSEVMVRDMVDVFLLLMLPGAGDELQGMKKGIMEMADILVVHKSDGDFETKARRARTDYVQALHLLPARPDGWTIPVLMASSLTGNGLSGVWENVLDFQKTTSANGAFGRRRQHQSLQWWEQSVETLVLEHTRRQLNDNPQAQQLQAAVLSGELSPVLAARKMLDMILTT